LSTMSNELLSRSKLGSFLGQTFGGDRDIYEVVGYQKTLQYEHFEAKYQRQDIAKRIVNAYPDATWRMEPEVYDTEEAKESVFEKAWKALLEKVRVFSYLNRADKLAGLGRYSILLLGVDDAPNKKSSGSSSQVSKLEIPATKASKLLFSQPYPEDHAVILTWDQNVKSPRYGLPLTYQITYDMGQSSIGEARTSVGVAPSQTYVVHHSRVIHVAEDCLISDVYGIPRLEAVYNRLDDLEKLIAGSAEMFWRGGYPGFSFEMDADSQELDAAGKTAMDTEIKKYIHGINRYMRLQGVTARNLSSPVADPTPNVTVQIQMISAATGIPQRILTGSERGELASTTDQENWNNRVAERRTDFAEPIILRPFVQRLIDLGILPTPKNNKFMVDWPDAQMLTEKEQQDIKKSKVDMIAAYISGGLDALIPPMFFLTRFLDMDEEEAQEIIDEAMKKMEEEQAQIEEDAQVAAAQQADDQDGEDASGQGQPDTTPTGGGKGRPPTPPTRGSSPSTNPPKRAFKIAGGEGSGNFGHEGIPGHQGGSSSGGGSGMEIKPEGMPLKGDKVEPIASHLRKTFEKGSLPLSKKISFGDAVITISGKTVIGGILTGGHENSTSWEMTDRTGKKHIVPKDQLRMIKGAKRVRDLTSEVLLVNALHINGGAGSGNRDHAGRQGEVGGSAPMGATKRVPTGKKDKDGKEITELVMANGRPIPKYVMKATGRPIPPAWTDVEVSTDPKADLMVTGRDEKGRRQPILSINARTKNSATKFGRTEELRTKLDAVTAEISKDIKSGDKTKRENASCLRLISETAIRPGNQRDMKAEHESFGATTLQGRHVIGRPGAVALRFVPGKSHGEIKTFSITDKAVGKDVLARAKAAGPKGLLFPTVTEKTLRVYTRGLDGGGFKPKDMRTARGTSLAVDTINRMDPPKNRASYKKSVKAVATVVSQHLGNTPTVALQSYIDPHVFLAWRKVK
jgi:hypothetical protein